ncbi:MAG: hypothetical protein H8E66_04255 [Planctomycetes bacterium]|nr:hypothetical protein [Planctomycetota bacterium]
MKNDKDPFGALRFYPIPVIPRGETREIKVFAPGEAFFVFDRAGEVNLA